MIFRRNIRRGQRRTPTDQLNLTRTTQAHDESSRKSIRLHLDDVNVNVANMVCFPSFILSVLGIVCLGNRVVICRALANERTAAMRYRSPRRSASGPLATLKVFVGGVCLFLDGRRRKKCDRICELEVVC